MSLRPTKIGKHLPSRSPSGSGPSRCFNREGNRLQTAEVS